MSKSIDDPAGTILLTDNPDEAAKKVMSATTDSMGTINFDWEKQPGVTNLLQVLALLSGLSQSEINNEWVGKTSYGDLKKALAESVRSFLTEFQTELAQVDDSAINTKLEASEEAMRQVASETLHKVQRAVGMRPN
jgi:tryptophanyl-tRNA synthetase